MSVDNPPTYYFTGIQFNPAFYNDTTLTQTEASSLYLLKNTPDTATALETFTGGIKTNSITPTTTSGSIVVGTASTFTDLKGAVKASNTFQTQALDPIFGGGNFNIGCGTLSTINLGTTSATAINIGSDAITTNMYGFTNLARNTSGTTNTYVECASTSTYNSIEFHSSGLFNTNADSRITAYGGASADEQGVIDIVAGVVYLYGSTNIGYRQQTFPTYIETLSAVNSNTIDFHSSGTNSVNYDTRFRATGGTAVSGNGTFAIETSILNLNPTSGGTLTINANGTLVMGSARNITLKTDGVAPTAQTQLGGTTTASLFSGTPINLTKYGTITITTPGIYIFSFAIYQVVSTLGSQNWLVLNGVGTTATNYGYGIVTTGSQISFSGTQVITATASAYDLVLNHVGSTFTTTFGGYFKATRIG